MDEEEKLLLCKGEVDVELLGQNQLSHRVKILVRLRGGLKKNDARVGSTSKFSLHFNLV